MRFYHFDRISLPLKYPTRRYVDKKTLNLTFPSLFAVLWTSPSASLKEVCLWGIIAALNVFFFLLVAEMFSVSLSKCLLPPVILGSRVISSSCPVFPPQPKLPLDSYSETLQLVFQSVYKRKRLWSTFKTMKFAKQTTWSIFQPDPYPSPSLGVSSFSWEQCPLFLGLSHISIPCNIPMAHSLDPLLENVLLWHPHQYWVISHHPNICNHPLHWVIFLSTFRLCPCISMGCLHWS